MTVTNDRTLKFLIISSDKHPAFRADTAVLFADEMVRRGHEIEWILQSEDDCKKSYVATWKSCKVLVGPTDNGASPLNRTRKHIYSIFHQLKLISRLKNETYDFVQVRNKFVVAIAAAVASRLFKTRFIFWLSFPFPEASLYKVRKNIARYPIFYFIRGHVLKFFLYKIIMPSAYHVFVQSEQMKKDVMAMGIPEKKLTPVPMGVSMKEFNHYRLTAGKTPELMDKKKKSIVYLGTLERSRKMDFLVKVHHQVLQSEPGTMLYFVGGGQDDEDIKLLEDCISELGLEESVVITGFLQRAEAMEYVKEADVCVSPFCPSPILDSTSPTKLVEYFAMEKAVVVNDHPDQRQVITDSKGGLCVPYDVTAFSEAVVELLVNPELTLSMGKAGRAYVEEQRDYARIADKVEEKYFQLLDDVKV